jgi:cation:H+ antiporter
LLLLALIDLAYRKHQMFAEATSGHVLSLGFAVVMLGVAGLNVLSGSRIGALPASLDVATVANIAIYLLALRVIFTFERRQLITSPAKDESSAQSGMSLRAASAGYALSAICVVAAGIWLPAATVKLANEMGVTSAFAGTLFMAIATSLPELAVTLSAIRLGALDMAIAALLGSNLFNMVVLAIDDIAYDGPLLSDASGVNAITLFSVLIANGLVAAGLIYRPEGRPLHAISWTSLGLILVYGLNVWLLMLATGRPG